MNDQEPSEECCKEQTSTEEQKELPEKEEKKTLKQAEVLTNSSIEMSFKTDSNLLRTFAASESINQMLQLNKIFSLEPDSSRLIFQQAEKREKKPNMPLS